MEWLGYLFIAAVVGAATLALYERRRGRKMRRDGPLPVPHDSQRAAYTESERIRAEGMALQNPGSGMP